MKSNIFVFPIQKPTAVITNPPAKTEYIAGEVFDPTGMVVRGTDINGNVYVVDEFKNLNSLKNLVQGQTNQKMYIMMGTDAVVINQPITVDGTGTYYNIIASADMECQNMFSSFTGGGSYRAGKTVSIRAFEKSDYEFTGWYDSEGNLVSRDNPYEFTATQNIHYYARAIEKVVPPLTPKYLTITANEDGVRITFASTKVSSDYVFPSFEYSLDNETWQEWEKNIEESRASYSTITLLQGQKLYLRGINEYISAQGGLAQFQTVGTFDCSGSIMSLLEPTGWSTDIDTWYCFNNLFADCSGILSSPQLPATKLSNHCYENMFKNCYNLLACPELPATTIPDYAYSGMFAQCTKIVDMPTLPAKVLNESCYKGMFTNCVSLSTVKELPATVVANNCYKEMFYGCVGLTIPSVIKATTLDKNCFKSMYKACTHLLSSPELLAVEDAENCYQEMFSGCSSLLVVNSINTVPKKKYTFDSMFSGCPNISSITVKFKEYNEDSFRQEFKVNPTWMPITAAEGTFTCYRALEQKIKLNLPPAGWTVQYLD